MKKYISFILKYSFYIISLIFINDPIGLLLVNLLFGILIIDNPIFAILPIISFLSFPWSYSLIILAIFIIYFFSYKFIKNNRYVSTFTMIINTIMINIFLYIIKDYKIAYFYISLFVFLIYLYINILHIFYKDENKHYSICKNSSLMHFILLVCYLLIFVYLDVNPLLYYYLSMQIFLLKKIKYNLILGIINFSFLLKIDLFVSSLMCISISFLPSSILLLRDFYNVFYWLLTVYGITINILNLKDKTITIENDYINCLFDDFLKYINNLNNEYNKSVYSKEIKENKLKELTNSFCENCTKNNICKNNINKRYSFISGAMIGINQNIYDCPFYENFKLDIKQLNIQKSYEFNAIQMLAFELNTLYNQSLTNKTEFEKFINILKNYQYYVTNLNLNFSSNSLFFNFKISSIKPPIDSLLIKSAYLAFGQTLELKNINDIYYMYQKPKIKITYAHAVLAKDGNLMSGDNYYIKKEPNSNYMFALSDGMGSGYNAYLESVDLLRIIKELSNYHFRTNTILNLLSEIYELRSNYDHYATLDLLTINPSTQSANLYKMGSSTTYIWHDNVLLPYQNKALPLKIDEMNSSYDIQISTGDIIFMLSDGITDFINQKEFTQLIDTSLSPEALCSKIVNYLKKKENNNLKDDLSLIVIKSI